MPALVVGSRVGAASGWDAPFYETADAKRWTVFDLHPHLQPPRMEVGAELERLAWGYDAFLVLTGSRPASFDPIPPSE